MSILLSDGCLDSHAGAIQEVGTPETPISPTCPPSVISAASKSDGEEQAVVAQEEATAAQSLHTLSVHAEATASMAITSSVQNAGRDIYNTVTTHVVNNTFNINQNQSPPAPESVLDQLREELKPKINNETERIRKEVRRWGRSLRKI